MLQLYSLTVSSIITNAWKRGSDYLRMHEKLLPTYLSRLDSNWKERQGLPDVLTLLRISSKMWYVFFVYFFFQIRLPCTFIQLVFYGSCHSVRYFFNWGNSLESMFNFWSYTTSFFETICCLAVFVMCGLIPVLEKVLILSTIFCYKQASPSNSTLLRFFSKMWNILK